MRKRIGTMGLAGLLLAGCGCSIFRKSQAASASPTVGSGSLTLAELQIEVMRFSDGYASSVAQASDEAAALAGTRLAHVTALRWKLEQATSAYLDATGENPVWNALDLVVFATVSRMVVEDEKIREAFGATAVQRLTERHRKLEADAWSLADEFLLPEQHQELENLLLEWRRQNPHTHSAASAHFRDFALTVGKVPQARDVKPTSIFSMLYINPLAGLDPTTVAIQQTRDLAQRTVAYAERAPTLMRWQAELLTYQLGDQPDAQQLLADVSRASRSMEGVSRTAEGLPELVDKERKEAIDQLFAGVAAERVAILKTLDSQESRFRELLGQTRLTLNAGTDMSNSLNTTVKSLDTFMHYVSPPTPPGAPTTAPAGKPFNVLDYGTAASQVGGMARDLNTLLSSAEHTAPQVAKMGQQAGEDLKQVIDHAFWRGLTLILILLVGSVPAALTYKALARRFAHAAPGPNSG